MSLLLADPARPPSAIRLRCPLPLPILVAGLLLQAVAGCASVSRSGPVSDDVASCRQLSQRGVAALERGDVATAEPLLAQAVKACPVDADARRGYGEALWRRGNASGAVAEIEQAATLAPHDTTLAVRAGQMNLTVGRTDRAARWADLAIRQDPRLATAWALRGRVQMHEGDFEQALADLHRSLGYAPDDTTVLADVAFSYRQLGEADRALSTLQRLSDLYPPNETPARILYEQGLALAALGRGDDAIESFTAAMRLGGSPAENLYQIAQVRWHSGQVAAARRAAMQALHVQPHHPASARLMHEIDLASRAGELLR